MIEHSFFGADIVCTFFDCFSPPVKAEWKGVKQNFKKKNLNLNIYLNVEQQNHNFYSILIDNRLKTDLVFSF